MAKAKTYITDIRAQVKADHGGKVPEHLNLTIRNYANALAMRDTLQEQILSDGATITGVGSMGQEVIRQHPLMPALYQWETLVQKYAKDLGGTAAKAAAKPEDPGDKKANNSLDDFIDGIKGLPIKH
jgi:hypothetical protein